MPPKILQFISRAEQLRLRGQRNYSRYMQVVKGFVEADGPERRQWQQESTEESVRDDAGTVAMVPFRVVRAFSGGDTSTMLVCRASNGHEEARLLTK